MSTTKQRRSQPPRSHHRTRRRKGRAVRRPARPSTRSRRGTGQGDSDAVLRRPARRLRRLPAVRRGGRGVCPQPGGIVHGSRPDRDGRPYSHRGDREAPQARCSRWWRPRDTALDGGRAARLRVAGTDRAGRPVRCPHRTVRGPHVGRESARTTTTPSSCATTTCASRATAACACAPSSEGDYAISVMNRGFETRSPPSSTGHLEDSACTFCGQCVQTCPTGALADKKAMRAAETPGEIEKTRTICPYCGVGCSVDLLTKGDTRRRAAGHGRPANEGRALRKGAVRLRLRPAPDRLTAPLVRASDGKLVETTWDEALDRAATGFKRDGAKSTAAQRSTPSPPGARPRGGLHPCRSSSARGSAPTT